MSKLPETFDNMAFVQSWPYRGEDKKIKGYVARYEDDEGNKKVLPYFKRNGEKWTAGIDLTPRPIYGLHLLQKYPDGSVLIIAEGEKSASVFSKLGFPAVTSLGGANAAKKSDWSPVTTFDVVISPDNDKAGEKYARDVYNELIKINPEIDVKIMRLPNLAEGGDIVDYVQQYFPDWDGYSHIDDDTESIKKKISRYIDRAKPVPDDWLAKSGQNFVWQKPNEFENEIHKVLPLDPKMIPEPLRKWLVDVGYRMQTPLDFAAVSAIICIASLIGCGCGIRPKQLDNWKIIANLWGLCIGRPSVMKKSPSMKEALQIIDRLQTIYNAKYQEEKSVDDVEIAIFKEKVAQIEKKIKQLQLEGDDDDSDELEPLKAEWVELNKKSESTVHHRLLKTNETSTQSLTKLHTCNERGVLVYKDEINSLLAYWAKKEGVQERAYFLSGWNGNESYTDYKIGRGLTYAPTICISLMGGIQPDILQVYLKQMSAGGNDGMLQRFQLMVWPDEPNEIKFVDAIPDMEAKERAYQIMANLADMDFIEHGAKAEENDGIPFYRFSLDAQKIVNNWLSELQAVKIPKEKNPIVQEHIGKYSKLMPSLALIFHLIDLADGKERNSISSNCAQRAIKWCKYLESHARRVYALNSPPGKSAAQHLADQIKAGKVSSPFNAKNIYDNHWAGLNNRIEVEAACNILIDENWLMIGEISKPSTGRPSLPEYYINPALL